MRSKLTFFLKVITIVSILFLPHFLFSQNGEGITGLDSTIVKVPVAIPVVDVIQTMEEVGQDIKQAEDKIKPKKTVLEIDSLYPIYAIFINEQKIEARAFVKANPNRQKVDNLIKKWQGFYEHLNTWESSINSYEEKNVISLDAVSFKEETWQLTYQNAKEEKIPAEILSLIKKTWDKIKQIKQGIIAENNDFLRLESKINEQKIIVNGVIEDLNALKNSNVYNLFYLRHLPLWKISIKTPNNKDSSDELVKSFSKNISGLLNFFKNNESNFYLYLIIVVLIALLFVFLKKAFLKYPFNEEDGDLQRAKNVIQNHSLSSIIFLSFVLAYAFFTSPPILFLDIVYLFALIAAIPLVKPFIYKRFKKIIYFVIIFYILDTAKTYVWFTSGQYRIYLLIEVILVVVVLFFFTRPYLKTRKMKIGKFGQLLISLTPVIYLLALISVVSNLLGYTNLTDLTIKIATRSGEMTIIFYGILMIAGGITTGLIHYHFSIKKTYEEAVKLKIEMKLMQIIRIIAFGTWFLYFLKMVDLYKPISDWITEVLTEPYKMGSITFTIGAILSFILILVISYLITSFISFLIDGNSLKFLKLPKGVPAAISLVLRYFIAIFAFILALSSLGMDFSKFNLMAGALGIGIGFGLQTIISNFISGLILVFERPILVGDTVEVNNLLGTVSHIGVRASNIRTFDGAEVVVPNNNLIANDLINWTLSDNVKRVEILIGTTYGSDPNEILNILTEVAVNCEYALKKPPPKALFSEFGDSSLNFRLLFWVHYEMGLQAKSDVSIDVYNRFKELGVEIPFPQQDVYIKDKTIDELGTANIQKAKKGSSTSANRSEKTKTQQKESYEDDDK